MCFLKKEYQTNHEFMTIGYSLTETSDEINTNINKFMIQFVFINKFSLRVHF